MDAMTRALYLPIKDKYALPSILITHDIDEALRMSHVIHAPEKKSIAYTHRIPEEVKRKGTQRKDCVLFQKTRFCGIFYLCAANASSMA